MVSQVLLSLLICSSLLTGRKSIPKMRVAYIEREVMVFSLPMSKVIEPSFLKKVKKVDHAVCGLPSMRLSKGKKGRSAVEAVMKRGCNFTGSSHVAVSSPVLVVVVVIGIMIDVVDDDG